MRRVVVEMEDDASPKLDWFYDAFDMGGWSPPISVTEITGLPPLPPAPDRWVVEGLEGTRVGGVWLSRSVARAVMAALEEYDPGGLTLCVRRLEDGEQ